MILSTTARAQSQDDRYDRDRDNANQNRRGRDWDRYGNYGGSAELRRTALNAGYNEGVREGRKDRGNGSRTEHRNLSSYQKATKDYSSRLGDRELYRCYFREAFEDGYNAESYARDNRDRRDRIDDRSQDRRDRNDDGNQDRLGRNEDGYGNCYQRQSAYQKATKDYSSGLGDREVYQRYFREAYEHGYADGYSGH